MSQAARPPNAGSASGTSDGERLSRRGFLGVAVGLGALTISPPLVRALEAPAENAPHVAGRAVRLAHLADIHMRPQELPQKAVARVMEQLHQLTPRPDLILTGGDLVHNARNSDEATAGRRFDALVAGLRDSDIPIRHCIGNHDVFGWGATSPIPEDHALYGKAMFQERLDLPETSHGLDLGPWRIVVADNILPARDAAGRRDYKGGFSESVYEFLGREFAAARAAGRPTLLCTHIPIVSAAGLQTAGAGEHRYVPLLNKLVADNPGRTLDLLDRHEVRLVLTGHLHQIERIAYQRTTHIGEGAVCGAWWNGPNRGTQAGYGVIDLQPDGTFEHAYLTYALPA